MILKIVFKILIAKVPVLLPGKVYLTKRKDKKMELFITVLCVLSIVAFISFYTLVIADIIISKERYRS